MKNKFLEAQDIFLDGINQICGKFGLNNIMAQLYALLYFNNKPLSLDDMVERLEISKGSASVNIRELESYGAVKRVWVKGSRKDYYQAETDISKLMLDRIRSMVQKRLSEVDDMVNSSYHVLNSVSAPNKEESGHIKVFKDRLGQIKYFHNNVASLLNLVNSGFVSNILSTKAKGKNKKRARV